MLHCIVRVWRRMLFLLLQSRSFSSKQTCLFCVRSARFGHRWVAENAKFKFLQMMRAQDWCFVSMVRYAGQPSSPAGRLAAQLPASLQIYNRAAFLHTDCTARWPRLSNLALTAICRPLLLSPPLPQGVLFIFQHFQRHKVYLFALCVSPFSRLGGEMLQHPSYWIHEFET